MKCSTGAPWCAGGPSAKRTTACSSSPTPWTTPSSACARSWKRITSSWIWTGWQGSAAQGSAGFQPALPRPAHAAQTKTPAPPSGTGVTFSRFSRSPFSSCSAPLRLVLVVYEHDGSQMQRAAAHPARRHLPVQVLDEPVGKPVLTARAARLLAALGPAMRAGVDHRVFLRIAVQGGPASEAHSDRFGRTNRHDETPSWVMDLHPLNWMRHPPSLLHIGNTFASLITMAGVPLSI